MESRALQLSKLFADEEYQGLTQMGLKPKDFGQVHVLTSVNLNPNDFRILLNPGVYVFWKGEQALYVGVGRRVINRMSNPNHGAVGKAIEECTSIEILFFENEGDAYWQEWQLIRHLQPVYNKVGLGNCLQTPRRRTLDAEK